MRLFDRSEPTRSIALGNRARDACQWAIAAEHYRAALVIAPENAAIWVQYGHALKETGHHGRAEAAYRRAIDESPATADAHVQLGILLRTQGRKAEAETAFLRALRLDPRLTPTSQDLAEFGWTEERLAELYRQGVAELPKRRRRASTITLADRARDLGEWSTAVRFYRKSLAGNPRRPEIWVQCGNVLKDNGEFPEAEAAYRKALTHDAHTADAHLQLGHVLKLQGKTEEAQAAYLRSFALDQSRNHALSELGGLGWSITALDELRRVCLEDGGSNEPDRTNGADKTDPWRAFRSQRPVAAPDLSPLKGLQPRGSIAVVLHLFDHTLWDEMRDAIRNISHPFDLFVSVTKGFSDHMRETVLSVFPHAHIFDFEDHGRDVGAFVVFLQSGVLFKYDLVCKLHTKRSAHLSRGDDWTNGDDWRRALIAGILGSPELVDRIIANFRAHPELGIVVADRNLLSGATKWTDNEHWLSRLLPRLGVSSDVTDCPFPGGNIFWVRSSLLRLLLDLSIELQDFEPEPLPLDGALGHAIERVFGLICRKTGMRVMEHGSLLNFTDSIVRLLVTDADG
jgi:tetratricopeptide (TPR) repeat protein